MPTADPDIWRAANLLVKRYGEDAAIVAAQQSDAPLAAGDIEREIVWRQIVGAVTELRRLTPDPGETVN